jgi:hypothetical protein
MSSSRAVPRNPWENERLASTMIRLARRRWILIASSALLLALAGSCAILSMPTKTLQAIDYRVTAYQIPAYIKGLNFVQRHYQYRLYVSRICAERTSDVECTMAIFDWTHGHIPPTPVGWPVVDDHPLHIIIRGHGKSDQIADVFVTLADYAGVPAFFRFVIAPSATAPLVLAFARLNGKWVVFDVEHHLVFHRQDGRLADVEELVSDPALVDAQAGGLIHGGRPYSAFLSRAALMPFDVPHPLRGEMQQPWPRIRFELGRVAGLEHE